MRLRHGRSSGASVTPLGWILLSVSALIAGAVTLGPREAEAPALAIGAVLLLAVVRGVSAERFGADRRGPPAISRFGLLSTAFVRDQSLQRGDLVIPAEPPSIADEIDQDLLLLQERLRREGRLAADR